MPRMPKWILPSASSLLVMLICLYFAPAAGADDWAKKMFPVTKHDFRTVGRGASAEYRFEFTNPYKEDVRIASVRTSCGCTTPTFSNELVKSRATSAVIAKFNTETHIGDKAAVLTVVFDKPYYSEVQLLVSGHIRTDVTFSPPEVNFGEMLAGQIKRQEVVVTHTGASNWEIKDVRSLCSDLTVGLQAAERGPSMVRYRMIIGTKDTLPEGEIRERLTLITNDQRFPTIDMAVTGRVRPSLEVSPASVGLGTIASGSRTEKRLVVRAEQDFTIRKVTSADPRFSFEVPEGSKKLHFVKVIFNADRNVGNVSRTIEIETDLGPDGKKAECLFSCTIAP